MIKVYLKWLKEREIIHRDEEREKFQEHDLREKKRENMTRKLGQEKIDYEDKKIRDRTEKKIAMEEKSALRREEERRKTEEALQAKRIAAELEKAKMDQDTAAIKAKAEAEAAAAIGHSPSSTVIRRYSRGRERLARRAVAGIGSRETA